MESADPVDESVEGNVQFWQANQPFQAELAPEGSDIRTIKMIVSITLGFTLVLATGYLAAVILSDGAILLRPSQQALERHDSYNELIQPASDDLTGKGIIACIVDSGIAIEHPDLEGVNLVGWRDFINGNGNPYDDHGHGTSMAGLLVANGWLKGMAKDVDLLVAKALGEDGSGSDAIVAALRERGWTDENLRYARPERVAHRYQPWLNAAWWDFMRGHRIEGGGE